MTQRPCDLPVKDGFRLRGESVSRLETFVDAAFAFAGSGWLLSAPGFAYMGIGPAMHFHHARFHRLRKRLPPREA